MHQESNLKKVLDSGKFAVTCELGPPKGTDLDVVKEKASLIKGYVDAVNVTDNQTAIVRLSSIATSHILHDLGIDPIMQMVCRDRNRIAMQSDLFGAYSLGIKNLLCLSGDHQTFGNHPESKNVFDIDSIQQLSMINKMKNEKKAYCGEEIEGDFDMFLGGASNPFGDPYEFRVIRLAKKINAGAKFIQTQCIYDMDKFEDFMKMVRDMGLHKKTYILAGVLPLKSFGMAKYMKNNVAGVQIPDELLNRMKTAKAAGKGMSAKEGIKICVEQIKRLRNIEGVHGVHVMAIEWEKKVPQIVEEAGLLPRPEL
ncbi:MAG: methylenetetrahydrofolate reductase [Victivallales bacterium]|nr:methylenetetrahydrofolate reductase [Victivallales bacterium]MCF7888861.1 methylenetetrahydrofolate reductase [Victivallales bacterium]